MIEGSGPREALRRPAARVREGEQQDLVAGGRPHACAGPRHCIAGDGESGFPL